MLVELVPKFGKKLGCLGWGRPWLTSGPRSIRNYMSKPWFLKLALEDEPSPLSRQIADVLKTSKGEGQLSQTQGDASNAAPNRAA